MSKIDDMFTNALNAMKERLPRSNGISYMVSDFLDSGNSIEDFGFDNSMFIDDINNDVRDYARSIIVENPAMVWKDLCDEFGVNIADTYYVTDQDAKILKQCYGNDFNTLKNNNPDAAEQLKEAMYSFIERAYVVEQGGWIDQYLDAYYEVFFEAVEEAVEEAKSDMD